MKSEKLINEILDYISDGKSLSEALKKVKISRTTWYKWLKEDSSLTDNYTRACVERTEVLADEIIDIINKPLPKTQKGDIDNAEVNNRRLQVDTMKWLMGKMNPKKYSEKAETSISATVEIKTTTVEYINLKPDQN